MARSSIQILFSLCCCAAVQTLSSPCQFKSPAPLQFVTVTRAGGCPLMVYFPTDKSSTDAYLSPAFCFTQSVESVFKICPKTDSVMNSGYLSIPLTVTDSDLLAEALGNLRPLLRGRRSLIFLQTMSVSEANGLKLPLTLMRQPGRETTFLRLQCKDTFCYDLFSQFERGVSDVLEKSELMVTMRIPGSETISMRVNATVANQSRYVNPVWSPSVLPSPQCMNLTRRQILKVDSACSVTILQRANQAGYFAVEPRLCYYGNYTGDINYGNGLVTLALEANSNRSRSIVTRFLSPQAPVSVTFMTIVAAEIRAAKSVTLMNFYGLKLSPDGDTVEMRVRCSDWKSCRQLRALVTNTTTELWRSIWFNVEFQLQSDTVCSWDSEMLAVSIADSKSACDLTSDLTNTSLLSAFHPVNASLCIRPQFVREIPLLSTDFCATRCFKASNCQAFRINSGSCQLFVFDKCSKHVRDCSCTRRGQVFVKKQPGLQPGALCPSGYGDDLCGVKYAVYSRYGDWNENRRMCESDSGLVIMADIMDNAEMNHAVTLYRKSLINSVWLGGYRASYSWKPAENWFWIGCNIPVDGSLWAPGEPNNRGGTENTVQLSDVSSSKLNDAGSNTFEVQGVLCECVSPFDY